MDTNELIHKIKKARSKDDLEELGIEHLGVDVDKRKTKEVLQAELINEAEDQAGPETKIHPGKMTPPTSMPKVRMARNIKTGRVMPWTAAIAKYSHMEEV
jgi:hypothetical protein